MRATIFLLLLLGLTRPTLAQTIFSLAPAQVMPGETVDLHIDDPFGCFHSDIPLVLREGNTIEVRFHIDDSLPPGGCPPTWTTPRFHALGTFTPGHYEVQVTTCTNAPPPLPACALHTALPLTVFGSSGARFTVPTLSGWLMLGLALVTMAMGTFRARRHRG